MLDAFTHVFSAVCGQNPDHTWASAGIALAASVALFRYKRSVMEVIGACAVAGLLVRLVAG